jgi:AraC family transcriptional regulator, regulatory protein of adaptative response / methylated-DNA-[protein]-cysteine methyltransferase
MSVLALGQVFGVRTTRIYCVPRCSARPKPENIVPFPNAEVARAAGYRACKRCKPDEPLPTIRWAIAETTLGPMLIAATDKGICRLSFDEGEAEVRARFPKADVIPADAAMKPWIVGAVQAVENPQAMPNLPLDLDGTPFQKAVWAELQRIPPSETRTYAQVAAAVGKPKAIRAAGTANGANRVAVLIPCHRVIGSDGTLHGYAYGLERKRELLRREGVMLSDN